MGFEQYSILEWEENNINDQYSTFEREDDNINQQYSKQDGMIKIRKFNKQDFTILSQQFYYGIILLSQKHF